MNLVYLNMLKLASACLHPLPLPQLAVLPWSQIVYELLNIEEEVLVMKYYKSRGSAM